MTLREASKRFEGLRKILLANGKIDWAETDLLLEFIEPYVRAENARFCKFKEVIIKCREDNQITEEESALLISEIKRISSFLQIEKVVETTFLAILGALVLGALVWIFV